MNSPLVSIITPSYNSAHFIRQAIESVQSQTYVNWEMIVVDDCSSDITVAVVEEYIRKDQRIRLILLSKNSDAAIARNTAIEAAKGQYIAFIDSDDIWLPEKLKRQIGFMQEKNVVFSFTAYKKMDEEGNINENVINVPETVTYSELLNSCVIGCLTAVYDAAQLGKIYLPNIVKRQDYALWLKILKRIDRAYGINEALAVYRVRKKSLSGNKLKAASYQWKVYRNVENLSFFKSLRHFMNYAYRGYIKYSK